MYIKRPTTLHLQLINESDHVCFQGMVEKWLLQVEDTMLTSLRHVIKESVAVYYNTPRDQWVLEWPGQVVLCGSSIFWTTEVSEAMKKENGIKVCRRW